MSEAGMSDRPLPANAGDTRSSSEAAVAVALGLVALMVGLGATMAGTWIAYWHAAAMSPLAGMMAAPEPDKVSLYLVVCGTVTTILGGLSIYRSQDL